MTKYSIHLDCEQVIALHHATVLRRAELARDVQAYTARPGQLGPRQAWADIADSAARDHRALAAIAAQLSAMVAAAAAEHRAAGRAAESAGDA